MVIIPKGWRKFSGFQITSLITKGSSPNWQGFSYQKNGIVFITSENVRDGFLDVSVPKYLSDSFHNKLKNSQLQRDDLLINIVGASIGRVCIYEGKFEKANINQAVCLFRPNEKLLPVYGLYYFQTPVNIKRLLGNQSETARPNLSLANFRDFKFILPNLPEQHKIAAILSKWDDAIEKTGRLIELKDRRKKGLMQRLLTGKKRMKGFEGEWTYLKANKIFQNISIKQNGASELLSVTQDNGVVPRSSLPGRVTMPSGDTNGFKKVEKGNFVISLRSFQGGIEYSEYNGLVSPAYTVLSPILKIEDEFFKYFFKSYIFIGRLAVAVIGIRDGKQVSYEDFSFLRLPYPSVKEQIAIVNILKKADSEITLLKTNLEKLKFQKRGLMQKLLTGVWRVRVER